ncbi:hypothetical protein LQW54_013339 [Pestalotiopsis sp. IQ-011]
MASTSESAVSQQHASAVSMVEPVQIPWRGAPLTIELRRSPAETGTGRGGPQVVVVFVNGLGRPRASWVEVAARLPPGCALLSYDRFGQGDTPHLPGDTPVELRGGDAAARDLYELLGELGRRGEPGFGGGLGSARIVLVAHSIGAAIARLLLAGQWRDGGKQQPAADDGPLDPRAAVKAALLLDPSIVNSDFVSLYPAPADGEDPELTRTREATRRVFHPSASNAERFDRASFLGLLPLAEAPVLPGRPRLTVVGHDPGVVFGEDAEKLGISTKYARQYIEPYWQEYNEELLLAVPEDRRRGPVVAERSDHFIQLDRPDLVADEIVRLVDLISTAEGE